MDINSVNITVGWLHEITQCQVSYFLLDLFELEDVLSNNLLEPVFILNTTTDRAVISIDNTFGHLSDPIVYLRVSAFDENDKLCSQESTRSQRIFYRIDTNQGKDKFHPFMLMVQYYCPGKNMKFHF